MIVVPIANFQWRLCRDSDDDRQANVQDTRLAADRTNPCPDGFVAVPTPVPIGQHVSQLATGKLI